jgi:hypothetical protein
MAAPERMYLPVDGFPQTEAFLLPGAAAAAAAATVETSVVVFPGNPGIAHAYTLFLERLREEWSHRGGLKGKSVRFWGVSYAGHSPPPPPTPPGDGAAASPSSSPSSSRFTLEQQIQHKLKFLERHVLPKTTKEVVLVGHSIGSKIALSVTKRLARRRSHQLRVAAVLLTPFLSTAPACPRQRAVKRLAHFHAPAGAAATLLGRALSALPLPEAVRLRLAAWASGADHLAACRGVAGLLAPSVVDEALFLALDEFQTLPEGVSGLPLADLERAGEVLLLAGPGDMWWPKAMHAAVQRRFEAAALAAAVTGEDGVEEGSGGPSATPGLAAVWDEGVSHLFGCSAQETVVVAAHVARWWEGRVAAGAGPATMPTPAQ